MTASTTREYRSQPRRALLALLTVGIGLAVPLLLTEAALRFLPVNSGVLSLAVNDANPIMRRTPNRRFTYSIEWNFAVVNRGWVNNAGFVNDGDYQPPSASLPPLLAVVGDSYVEALMVPFPETMQGRLATGLGGQGRVYSFGASGAPLSQYLMEAQFARDRYRPAGLVVIVVGNDFDESLLRYKTEPGFHYFREHDDSLELTRIDYAPSLARRLLRSSAVARYALLNLGLAEALGRLRAPAPPASYVGNTAAAADTTRVRASEQAVAEFLRELPERSGLPAERILLLVDGIRPQLYAPAELPGVEGSFAARMRWFFLARAREMGFETVDLQPRFIAEHRRTGARFEFPTDAHWNGEGHTVAAAAVRGSQLWGMLFGEPATAGRRAGQGR